MSELNYYNTFDFKIVFFMTQFVLALFQDYNSSTTLSHFRLYQCSGIVVAISDYINVVAL